MEQMIQALELLRNEYRFRGYIHAKTIPGADPALVTRLGLLADRLSVNIELPSEQSLSLLAPNKTKRAILAPMGLVRDGMAENKRELAVYRHAPVSYTHLDVYKRQTKPQQFCRIRWNRICDDYV